jgi:hypothetical protein
MNELTYKFDSLNVEDNIELKRILYTFYYNNTRVYSEYSSMGSTNVYHIFGDGIILINVTIPNDIEDILRKLNIKHNMITKRLSRDNEYGIIERNQTDVMLDYIEDMYKKYCNKN